MTKYHLKDFPNLTILAQLATTLQLAVNVGSLLRTWFRALTEMASLKVNLGPKRPAFPFKEALVKWKEVKQGKLFNMKYKLSLIMMWT